MTDKYLEQSYEEGKLPAGTFARNEWRTDRALNAQKFRDGVMERIAGRSYGWKPHVYQKV